MNGLGNEGAFGVADIIRQSGTITHLDVTYNRIGVPGAQSIGKALEGNEVLKVFKVEYLLRMFGVNGLVPSVLLTFLKNNNKNSLFVFENTAWQYVQNTM